LKIKKIIFLSISSILLGGCVETTALLGPAVTGSTSGNVYQATISFASGEAILKKTGKYPMQHVQYLLEKAEKSKINQSFTEIKENINNLEIVSDEFYASVKKLYLNDKSPIDGRNN